MNIRRQKRLEGTIRLVVSSALQGKVSDPRMDVMASVTRVELARDLSVADVYISVMGSVGQQSAFMQGLEHAGGFIQSLVAQKLTTRTCPTLKFHLDESLKKGFETIQKIESVMAELSRRSSSQAQADQANDDPNEQQDTKPAPERQDE